MAGYLDDDGQQSVATPAKVYLDDNGNPQPAPTPASTLQSAVSYGVQQDPVQHAKLLRLQQQLGIPPVVSQGNEPQVQQAADVNSIDYPRFAAANPRTTAWASDPDNAAVSGVDEIQRLGGIEQNAAAMRLPPPSITAYTPSLWEKFTAGAARAYRAVTGNDPSNLYEYPLTRAGIDITAGTSGLIGNVGSFAGWHGDGPTRENLLQRIESGLSSETNTLSGATFHDSNALDFLAKNVAPMVPAVLATGGTSLLADTLGVSKTAAKVLAGLTVGGMFDLDQAGKTYTQVAGAGGSDYAARLAANRVAAIGAIPNALFGATDVVPLLRDNPLLTSLGLGGLTGATGQVGQNLVTGKPWSTGVPGAALQGAAMQGGMHIGIGTFLAPAVDAAEQSQLRERSPEKFDQAMQTIFAGDPSLRIPSEQFNQYFNSKGMDPADVARDLGSTNYAEAVMSGGDVEVPPADFLSKLDPEHQKALLPDIVDPATGLTARQHQEGRDELEQWATGGGAEKLSADTAAADAETAATPEYQAVHEGLRQRYVDAGETPEVAETLATKDANAYSNLARSAGMKPSELLGLYNPKVVSGEAPDAQTLHQDAIDNIRSVVEAAKEPGESKKWTVYAPVSQWLENTARQAGHELEGYSHGIDANAIRHAMEEHGNAVVEVKRGQLPITDADFEQIPRIVSEPDRVIFGGKTADGLDSIGYVKKLDDGSIAYVEEKRTGRKRLSAKTMFKYPAAKDVDDIAANVPSNARSDGERTTPIVVPGPKTGNGTLEQSSVEGTRGWFRTLPDGSYEIGKTSIGDLSTFVHEPAHAYLKILGDLAKRDGASDVLKGDYQKVLDFLGAKDGEPFTREQQETWARANEQYLREGKAPSPGLKGAFQRFAIWLGSVYKKASDLGVNLSDEIRGVFDRLYAAEDGVSKAENEAGGKLFSSAEEAGWTDEEFQKYADARGVGVEQAKAEVLAKLNEASLREQTDAWRSEEKNVRSAMTAKIDESPEYTAIRALRRGSMDDGTPLTMSRDELVKQFGEDRVQQLQRQHPGLYRNEGGLDPETAAEMLGFRSAADLVSDIETLPRRSAAIEQATREYMTAKHGDIRYDGTLEDQARIALENDKRADSLYSELKALRKKLADVQGKAAGQKQAMRAIDVAPIDAYREAAHQMVEGKAVADIQPTRYLDASRKYSREAFDALRKGDTAAAEAAKHKELLNHFLFREATKAKEYVAKFEAYAKRVQKTPVQEKLGLAGGDFRDQFNRILGRYGLGPNVPAPERTLAEWAAAQYAEGKEPAIAPDILNEARSTNYRNAPVSEIRMVHDALVNVRKLAALELGMEVNGRRIEFEKAKSEMIDSARANLKSKPIPVFDDTDYTSLTNRAIGVAAASTRMEFLMNRLDGGTHGPWHDYLWNRYEDSKGDEFAMQHEWTKAVNDHVAQESERQGLRLLDKVSVDGIPASEPLTRKRLIAMALNMGNESNFDRLLRTFDARGWDPTVLEKLPGMLTREEWKFVQKIWDSLTPMGERMGTLEKRLTGLPPVMVKATPFTVKLADGTEMEMQGGYFPIMNDPNTTLKGYQDDSATAAQNLMQMGYGRATTSRGYTKARTGFGGPLLLDYDRVLGSHIAKATKDISHREFMLASNRLLTDPEIRQALRETLGPRYERQFMPWLRATVNDRNGSLESVHGDIPSLVEKGRSNLVKATLGFKVSTSLLQFTHLPRVMLFTKPGPYMSSLVDFWKNPAEMTQTIRDLSPNEMRFRGDNLDRDYRAALESVAGKKDLGANFVRFGNATMKYLDHVISFPLWHSVYNDSLIKNVELPTDEAHSRAVHDADAAVRMGLGTGTPGDLPPIMREQDVFSRFETSLYGFHNMNWNIMRHKVVGDFARDRNYAKLAGGVALGWLIPALASAYVQGDGPKDDENWGLWAAKRALFFAGGTLPLLKDAVSLVDRGSLNPMVNYAEKIAKTYKTATKDDVDTTALGIDALEYFGDGLGVPGTAQAAHMARYYHAVEEGKIDNPNAWDAVVGGAHR